MLYLDVISRRVVILSSNSREVWRYKGSETKDATINDAGKTRIAAAPPILKINRQRISNHVLRNNIQ